LGEKEEEDMSLQIGCQTYTWEMLGEKWTGTQEKIVDLIASAGYEGVEFSTAMMGRYLEAPDAFQRMVEGKGLSVAALAYARDGFTDEMRFMDDLAGAKKALLFCSELGVPLCLGGPAAQEEEDKDEKMTRAVRFYRTVAEMGAQRDVTVCVHPHSHHGSLVESAEEYDQLLSLTEACGLRFNPDAGHIVRGGQDLLDCVERHADKIVHVHVKDVDEKGRWKTLGDGVIRWEAFFETLERVGYEGWIVAEEESALAKRSQKKAIKKNREYLRSLGPMFE